MTDPFVHLHNHSEYSMLDGFSRLGDMVNRAVELEQPAIALTDHGNLHGAIEFYQKATKAGITPIIGVEGYVADGPRDERNPQKRSPFHMTVLAQNRTGYLSPPPTSKASTTVPGWIGSFLKNIRKGS